MSEQSRYLFFFRKFTFCRHKYSCFESGLRTLYQTVGFYFLARAVSQIFFKGKIFELFSE